MTASSIETAELGPRRRTAAKRQAAAQGARHAGSGGASCSSCVITVVALVPVVRRRVAGVHARRRLDHQRRVHPGELQQRLRQHRRAYWLQNSLLVTLGTVVVSVIVAAPAGYVLSRGRSRAVSGYSLLLFVIQSLPVITAVIPLFILFANLGLVDNLIGLTIVYVGTSMSVATWMMAAYMDSIPIILEEAAWIDGCLGVRRLQQDRAAQLPARGAVHRDLHVPGGLERLPRRHRVPALRDRRFTLPLGLQSFFQQNATDWGSVMAVAVVMMLPPVIVVRRPEQVLQRRRHRRVARRPVGSSSALLPTSTARPADHASPPRSSSATAGRTR